ncbi:transglycosylase domain-containing protein [Salsuginibacillus kocurii]|uniref:transglycosylase domain-containing protein n=1 Tax=Salsuginibacillus kocurii TaxID=427078 RepID=UPI000375524D|nr:PBP1A family penicillin-binding protein [Salsuginibacillus kocurii]
MRRKRILLPVIFLLAGMVLAVGTYAAVLITGSLLVDESKFVMDETSYIVDENGEEVAHLYQENRETVDLTEIPQHVQDAFIAVEDVRFYEHQGIDIRAIGRAVYRDIMAGSLDEGGSTITQQLAKNVFLEHDQTWMRKTQEVLIAMHLERNYSKNELLEMYLNQIYFGHGAHGIQVASQLYFNKNVSELNVHEGALLAALPKGPNMYSPAVDADRAKERRDTVLAVMERHGFLDAEEASAYQGRTVSEDLYRNSNDPAYATYIDAIYEEAEKSYDLSREELRTGGYTIQIPVDQEYQEASYQLLQEDEYFPGNNDTTEAAVVLMDHHSGGVQAIQGGREYESESLNRAFIARQPGSSFKPFSVYAPALESGRYEPYSLLKDEEMDMDGYQPRNHDRTYQGQVTMREAITQSTNTSAVWLLDQLGIDYSIEWMKEAGLELDDDGYSIALGGLTDGFSPLEMAEAYTIFSSNGVRQNASFIDGIVNRQGDLVEMNEEAKATADEEVQVMSEQNAWYMTEMLKDVVDEGTGTNGHTDHALAGKTGTTSFTEVEGAARDAWFAGYTPEVTGALWIGNDETREDSYLEGGSAYATALFKEIIDTKAPTEQAVAFNKPDHVEELEEPVELEQVDNLEASLSLRGGGIINVHLEWTPATDERIEYHVYEVSGDVSEKVATVEGGEEYTVNGVNVFSLQEYMVVPHNPQTGEDGSPSNVASVDVGLWF